MRNETGADTVELRARNTFTDRTVNSADGLHKTRVQQQHVVTSDGYPPIDLELEQHLASSSGWRERGPWEVAGARFVGVAAQVNRG